EQDDIAKCGRFHWRACTRARADVGRELAVVIEAARAEHDLVTRSGPAAAKRAADVAGADQADFRLRVLRDRNRARKRQQAHQGGRENGPEQLTTRLADVSCAHRNLLVRADSPVSEDSKSADRPHWPRRSSRAPG